MTRVRTVNGSIPADQLGITLIHEHLVVDVRRPWERPATYREDVETIVAPMVDHLRAVREQGVRTIADCTPTDLGQHVEAYRVVAERTGLQVVYAHGTYRDGWLPSWVKDASVEALADWYASGLDAGAAFLKLGCDPDGPSPAEARCATAAGVASRRTGCLVACHVGWAEPAERALDAFESGGGDPSRFVVVHVQNEPDFNRHLELARRGAWVEYDAIGARPDDAQYVQWIRGMAEDALLERVLVSQDACAYVVGDGGVQRQHRFDHLLGRFVPALRAAGFDQPALDRLLILNPARALVPFGA